MTNDINWYEHVYYDPTSPTCLRWNRDCLSGTGRIHRHKGDVAGKVNGRSTLQMFYKYYLTYRIVWELFNGKIPPKMTVDHIDRDCSNNKIENLRLTSLAVNTRNRKLSRVNTTGVTGVRLRLNQQGGWTYCATWVDLEGKHRSRTFTWKLYGEEEAFRLACEYRKTMLEELNKLGQGYSETHGFCNEVICA